MWNKLADWIAGIIRKELAELAAVLGKDTEEAAKRAESDLAAIKAHVEQELTKAKQELIGFNSTAFLNLRDDVRNARAAGGNDLSAVRAAVVAEILNIANDTKVAFADVKSHVSGVAVSVKNHIGTTSAQTSDNLLHELKAHVQKTIPEATPARENGSLQFHRDAVLAVAVNAIQELHALIKAQDARIAALEAKS